jgi:hypothetical protein
MTTGQIIYLIVGIAFVIGELTIIAKDINAIVHGKY